MDEVQFLGYLVVAIVTLGGFVTVISKLTQPINELRIVIQKLNDNIDSLKTSDNRHDKKIEEHDKHIDKLDHRVDKLETRVDMHLRKDGQNEN